MSITPERRTEVIAEYATAANDTGSPEVQVAILSERISNLTEHLKTHSKDFHSRRGLLVLVGQRRSLLDYLKRKNAKRYETLIGRLKTPPVKEEVAFLKKSDAKNFCYAGPWALAPPRARIVGWAFSPPFTGTS